jgi:hypothetical protein
MANNPKANIDKFICKPNATINSNRLAVLIHAEEMDPDTRMGTGKSYTIGMTTTDAMRLLGILEHMQKMYDLKKPDHPPEVIHVPPKAEQN